MNLLPIDELNSLRTRIAPIFAEYKAGKRSKKKTRDDIIDELLDLLLLAYTFGCEDANEMLGTQIAPTYNEMRESVYKKVAGETWEERVDKYLDMYAPVPGMTPSEPVIPTTPSVPGTKPTAKKGETAIEDIPGLGDIMRIADTETHRVYNEAGFKTAKLGGAKTKKWICHFHNSRDWHIYMHGVEIPIDAEFYTYLGNHALYPGEFGVAEEDCNCICTLEFKR